MRLTDKVAISNILGKESSPYLKQHANNPVHWQTWEKTDFEALQKENKLLLISIGYATCHWCHVMEHECFESEVVAEQMNANFHCIKVDREERPDLDHIYMQALQLLSGQGGWPLNIVALPDGRPIWGCTYLPKEQWQASLHKIRALQEEKPTYLQEYAQQFEQGFLENQKLETRPKSKKGDSSFSVFLPELLKGRDTLWGGYRAPKFPMPVQLQCFQMAAFFGVSDEAQEHFETTLSKIALGGIHDPIEGGFSRYAVDSHWHIPHFEKMGYDNGQLLSVFSEAYLERPIPLYKDRIYSIYRFLKNRLQQQSGGFSCALDADSLNAEEKPEEGAYYVWKKEELKKLLGTDYDFFQDIYNRNDIGHWEKENYVLFQTESLAAYAAKNGQSVISLQKQLEKCRQILESARQKRPQPLIDTKVLCGWNSLIVSGLCKAYQATQDPAIKQMALQTLSFLKTEMMGPEGQVLRVWKKDNEGFLEDYALLIQALIRSYQTFFDSEWLGLAKILLDYSLQTFYDPEIDFFYFKNKKHNDSLFNPIEIEDNVISSSNTVMTENQWWLGRYFSNTSWTQAAKNRVQRMHSKIASYPRGYALWIQLGLLQEQPQVELVIAGPEAFKHITKFAFAYQPHLCLLISEKTEDEKIFPLLLNRMDSQSTRFYVCKNQSCLLPTESADDARKQLSAALRF